MEPSKEKENPESIEEKRRFFLVVTDDAQVVAGFVDVFKCQDVGDGGVVDEFSFALGSNVRREHVVCFESIGEIFTNVYGDK